MTTKMDRDRVPSSLSGPDPAGHRKQRAMKKSSGKVSQVELLKKLPKSCSVVTPRKGSKTVTIKCSSTKDAKVVRESLDKRGPARRDETQSEKARKGKNPFIVASCVVSIVEKALKTDGRRKAHQGDVSRAFAICRASFARSGTLAGASLTAAGKKRDAEKRKTAGAEKVHETFAKLEKYLEQAREG